jgi:hypothetical protein
VDSRVRVRGLGEYEGSVGSRVWWFGGCGK